MAFITNFFISCLAELIKWSSPWYIKETVYRLCARICPYILFVLITIIFVLFPTSEKNALYRISPLQNPSEPSIPGESKISSLLLPQKTSISRVPKTYERTDIPSPQDSSLNFAPETCEQCFPTPEKLKHHVQLWQAIFSQYSSRQVVLYDSWHAQLVYTVVDLDKTPNITSIIRKYRRILRTLAQKEKQKKLKTLTSEEQRVYNLFKNISEKNKFSKAASRQMRGQSGQREQFIEAIRRLGLYQQQFIQIFREHNLPESLIMIPFVESYFKYSAYSRAGAAGVWQFMPATARMYGLQMNRAVDERYDPFKSAVSAAKLLKANYEIFQSWPLAITAYMHGPAGVRKAVKRTGTSDLGEITRKYRTKNFGFYSRNYYAQFVAAVQIMQDPQKYFGDIKQLPALQYDEVTIPRRMFLTEIVTLGSVSKEELVALNRDLKRTVVRSKTPIPKNFVLKLPAGTKQEFLLNLQEQAAVDAKQAKAEKNL